MNKENKIDFKYTYLSDYRFPDFIIPNIYLEFIIDKKFIKVNAELSIIKNQNNNDILNLKGSDITLLNIFKDGKKLKENEFWIEKEKLLISAKDKANFVLRIESLIYPKSNNSLLGIYESNKIITTQCEAEGFRRICFHPDRPDLLSKYKVRIEADKILYPVLLSNGNLISASKLKDNRHEVIWEDPYPKPSYLFALVAGDLKCIKDIYFTKTNKKINLHIYVEDGNQKYVEHSFNSLKKAMRWDEDKYNLEYDLELFNIVAIRHFNMGAMENKSLNIFNSKLILADTETTTDEELERIEGVIAHEYFHNWTGNRITCRDWFQLSLKEGLTVFRDQEFTADMHNYQIKRISDAKFLRKNQFREDSGPTSHPVIPNKYLEIDNFYTTTIYEKGSEIIRMLETIMQKNYFKEGFKAFIKKYDGKAATIDQFVETVIGINKVIEIDIDQFKLWYKQNGTPEIEFKRIWNKSDKELTILIKQNNPNIKNKLNKFPLIIPINICVFTGINNFRKIKFILKEKEDRISIQNIETSLANPIVSYFREFSAPVKWKTDLSFEEELFLIENETDLFTISDSIKRIYFYIIKIYLESKNTLNLEQKLFSSLRNIFSNRKDMHLSLLCDLINIPSFSDLESEIENIDPLKIFKILDLLNLKLANNLKTELSQKSKEIENEINKPWPEGKDERKLLETIWRLLLNCKGTVFRKKIISFINGNNMTLSKAALNAFQKFDSKERIKASEIFFKKWKNNNIVLDTWFLFSASIERDDPYTHLESLFNHKLFDFKSPNTLRSVLNGFALNNRSFHDKEGKGYHYVAEKIIKYDKVNPIIISRFLKIFSRWNSYDDPYRNNMLEILKYIDSHKLSNNSREVINLMLKNQSNR
ncbi:MAG: aminopeptidase N [Prochlorococcus sp. SP3034]|nr:aminopeptidase N [Prochlorococcus sp. SP3034]